jgi:hypothetical protein
VVNRPLARLLRRYQLSLGYTPGPVLLACVILALVAGLGVGRARHSGQQLACLLWLATGLGLLLAADLYEFSWRYQLPALVTIPPAAALALSALTSPRAAREPPATQEPRGPDDTAPARQDDTAPARQDDTAPAMQDDTAPAMQDDPAARRHPARAEPPEGMAHTQEPAEPGPAEHHVHAAGSPDPEGTQASPGPAPG